VLRPRSGNKKLPSVREMPIFGIKGRVKEASLGMIRDSFTVTADKSGKETTNKTLSNENSKCTTCIKFLSASLTVTFFFFFFWL
jgi:hypothetical protein